MRGLAFLICAMLPGAVLAEPVVLRVEAQRAAAAPHCRVCAWRWRAVRNACAYCAVGIER